MNPNVKDGDAWSGEPLPRGRHKLPREAVRASQRERLLRAMGELVGEKGFEATTVPAVIAAARVSSNTFYGFFRDKTECFIAVCEELGDELLRQITAFSAGAASPTEALANFNRGLDTYLRWWSDRPALARAYFVELPVAGARATEERTRQYERFAAIHHDVAARARAHFPGAPPLRDAEVRAAVVVMTELVAEEVRAGRVETIPQLAGDLRYLLLKLLVGDEAARLADAAS